MFLSWTGKGIVTFYILLGAIFVAVPAYVIVPAMFSEDGSALAPDNMQFLFAFYLLVVAIATVPLGRLVLKQPQRKILIDPKTGEEHLIVAQHAIYGVNVRYHTYVFLAGSAIFFVVGLLVS